MVDTEVRSERSVIIFIATLTAGGAERVASILANIWAKQMSVTVITYFTAETFFALDPRVRVECLRMQAGRDTIQRSIDVARAALRFRRLVRSIAPDFVLSFMNKYNAFCLGSLAGTDIPVVVSERGSPEERLPWMRVVARDFTYPRAAGLIAQTAGGLNHIARCTKLRTAIAIPNPVQRIIPPECRRPEALILNVGRLVEGKGHDQLLEAFSMMHAKHWRLVLCGAGPLQHALEQQAEALGIGDRVTFLGEVRDLAPLYRQAGLFAFSSLSEGYPNALAEALVSGLPCVSYDCPTGPAEMIDHGHNGLLVPVGDIEGLARALDELAGSARYAASLGEVASELGTLLAPEAISARYLAFCSTAAGLGPT